MREPISVVDDTSNRNHYVFITPKKGASFDADGQV